MTPPNSEKAFAAAAHLCAFRVKLDELYGLASDGSFALKMVHEHWNRSFAQQRQSDGIDHDSREVFYGTSDPNDVNATYQHRTTAARILSRNCVGGLHEQLLYQSIIVLAYMFWEDKTRHKFANELGLSKNKISSEVFGDLRIYRHAIVHNNGVLDAKTKVFQYISTGTTIHLNRQQFTHLLAALIDELNSLCVRHLHKRGLFEFERKLNPRNE